jgi:hypothetical protein
MFDPIAAPPRLDRKRLAKHLNYSLVQRKAAAVLLRFQCGGHLGRNIPNRKMLCIHNCILLHSIFEVNRGTPPK